MKHILLTMLLLVSCNCGGDSSVADSGNFKLDAVITNQNRVACLIYYSQTPFGMGLDSTLLVKDGSSYSLLATTKKSGETHSEAVTRIVEKLSGVPLFSGAGFSGATKETAYYVGFFENDEKVNLQSNVKIVKIDDAPNLNFNPEEDKRFISYITELVGNSK